MQQNGNEVGVEVAGPSNVEGCYGGGCQHGGIGELSGEGAARARAEVVFASRREEVVAAMSTALRSLGEAHGRAGLPRGWGGRSAASEVEKHWLEKIGAVQQLDSCVGLLLPMTNVGKGSVKNDVVKAVGMAMEGGLTVDKVLAVCHVVVVGEVGKEEERTLCGGSNARLTSRRKRKQQHQPPRQPRQPASGSPWLDFALALFKQLVVVARGTPAVMKDDNTPLPVTLPLDAFDSGVLDGQCRQVTERHMEVNGWAGMCKADVKWVGIGVMEQQGWLCVEGGRVGRRYRNSTVSVWREVLAAQHPEHELQKMLTCGEWCGAGWLELEGVHVDILRMWGRLMEQCQLQQSRSDGNVLLSMQVISLVVGRVSGKFLKGGREEDGADLPMEEVVWCAVLLALSRGWAVASKLHRRNLKWWCNKALEVVARWKLYPLEGVLAASEGGGDDMALRCLLLENPRASKIWNRKELKSTNQWRLDTSWCRFHHTWSVRQGRKQRLPYILRKHTRVLHTVPGLQLPPLCCSGNRCLLMRVFKKRKHRFTLAGRRGPSLLPGGGDYWANVMPSGFLHHCVTHLRGWLMQLRGVSNPRVLVVEPCCGTGSAGNDLDEIPGCDRLPGPEWEYGLQTPDGIYVAGQELGWEEERAGRCISSWDARQDIHRMEKHHGCEYDAVLFVVPTPCTPFSQASVRYHGGAGDASGTARRGAEGRRRRADARVMRMALEQYNTVYDRSWSWLYAIDGQGSATTSGDEFEGDSAEGGNERGGDGSSSCDRVADGCVMAHWDRPSLWEGDGTDYTSDSSTSPPAGETVITPATAAQVELQFRELMLASSGQANSHLYGHNDAVCADSMTSSAGASHAGTAATPALQGGEMQEDGLVGRRVRVWWPGDALWYEGVVVGPRSFGGQLRWTVKYDDGDCKHHNFTKCGNADVWELL